jgi:enoyl-CoA hydratase/carnithine racemase
LRRSVLSNQPTILFDRSHHVGRLTLSHPDKNNAMTYTMWLGLPELVSRCQADANVRVIVLTGAGTEFCAGADISEFGVRRSDEAGARAYEEAVTAANDALLHAAKPTVALVRGACYGGGVGLALACDIRLASANARFCVPAARLGLGYSFDNIALVVSRIGFAAAADLLFSARVLDATQAQRDGLVRDVFSEDVFVQEATAYVAQIAGNAPLTLMAAKAGLSELAKPEMSRDITRVTDAVAQCFSSEDFAEGRRAFTDRRQPEFRGR